MPKMSGLQFIKLLRELPGFVLPRYLPLLLKPMRANGMKLKKLGATGWLVNLPAAPIY